MAITLAAAVDADGTQDAQTIPRVNRRNAAQRAYQIVISGTITVAVQGSIDGTNFVSILTGKTSSEIGLITLYPYMRVVTSGTSGGTASVFIDADA